MPILLSPLLHHTVYLAYKAYEVFLLLAMLMKRRPLPEGGVAPSYTFGLPIFDPCSRSRAMVLCISVPQDAKFDFISTNDPIAKLLIFSRT